MAVKKKTKKIYDIMNMREIEVPDDSIKDGKDMATPDLLEPMLDTGRSPDADLFYAPSHDDKRPTVQDVLQREYPEVMRQPDPLIVQIAILRELIRMRGCE